MAADADFREHDTLMEYHLNGGQDLTDASIP